MRRRIVQTLLATTIVLVAPQVRAQEEAAAGGTTEAAAGGTTEAAAGGATADAAVVATGDGGLFIETTVGAAVPLGDAAYDVLIDTSFVPTVIVGYAFPLGGGEASIAPEGLLTYTPLTTEDWDIGANAVDVYSGRLRIAGAARFQIELDNVYVFTHFGVGFELIHANWEYSVGPAHFEDDESDGGMMLLAGLGFGARVADWIGITMRLDFPTGVHWDEDDGGVDYDYHSTDVELALGVTFFL